MAQKMVYSCVGKRGFERQVQSVPERAGGSRLAPSKFRYFRPSSHPNPFRKPFVRMHEIFREDLMRDTYSSFLFPWRLLPPLRLY